MTISEERFEFTSRAKRNLAILVVVGIVLLLIGIFSNMGGSGHGHEEHAVLQTSASSQLVAFNGSEGEHAAAAEHHETATWLKRLYVDLWINNVFFTGLGIIGLFFVAI